jgi:hypothetical protein
VLRGLVAAGLVELLYGESVFREPDGYALLVALGALLAVVVSVAAGLRRPRRNGVLVAVNLVLALAAVAVIWNAVDDLRAAARDDGAVVTEAPVADAPSDLLYKGRPVENVYAFDRERRLLQDVRLYMQDGRPLAIGGPGSPNRRGVRTRTGTVVFNAFPIRYFEPGTKRVANPAAGAPERPDPLATKALGPERR